MARPSKPVNVLRMEGKSHRTNAELEFRQAQEDATMSGEKIKEQPVVRKNKVAHACFLRIRKLLEKIGKADALYEGVINRYAILFAECLEFEEKRERFYESIEKIEREFDALEEDKKKYTEYYKALATMMSQVINCDRQIMAKRKMMLDIEKENVMTIASALRAIPKKPVEEDMDDPMDHLLRMGRRVQ